VANPASNGPWRILVLDPDATDPKSILATVARPEDVRPARHDAAAVDDVIATWVALSSGLYRPAFTAMPAAQCWRIDEPRGTRSCGTARNPRRIHVPGLARNRGDIALPPQGLFASLRPTDR
jgi:hypothetical protein